MMGSTPHWEGPPSILGVTIRRSAVSGRLYLGVGIGLAIFYGVVLGLGDGSAFETVFPVLLPVVAVVGALGAMVIFTSDRLKGVFEYLIAYGVSPRRLFATVLATSLVLETVVLAATLAGGLGAYRASGHALSLGLAATLALYSVPMSYAAVAFMTSVGVFWTSLSSPREGMNSPIGLLPIVGVGPPLVTLVLALAVNALHAVSVYTVTSAAIATVAALVGALAALTGRLLHPERLLSPA
jgi:hypothetical protein